MYNHTFDLNALHSDITHRIEGEKNDFIDFNVCGNLVKTCNGKSNVGACYTKNGTQKIIGKQNI